MTITTKPGNVAAPAAHPAATLFGLAIALFAGPLFIAAYRFMGGEIRSDAQAIVREIGVFLLVGLLLWIIRSREFLPFSSIGLQTGRLGRSLWRGCLLAVVMLLVTVGLYLLLQRFGIHLGESSKGAFQPSLPVVTLVMFRAGIAEEIFYRGYAIERLQVITGNAWVAALLPLVVFAFAHYRQGAGGIVAAFVLGGIATAFYWRCRDLVANIVGHTVADLVLNVGLPLVSGS